MFVDAPGNDGFTKLLLHFDAANGSTALKDFSAQNHSVTCVGTAAVSTAQSVFGGSSIALGAGGNYITTPDSADWDFGAGDFAHEMRTRHTTIPSGGLSGTINTIFWFQEDAGPPLTRIITGLAADGSVFFLAVTAGVITAFYQSANLGLSINTWYAWAFARSGPNLRIFRDGTSIALTITTAIGTLPNVAAPLIFGASNVTLIGPAFADEIRVSKGTDRGLTANYTIAPCSFG